MAEISLSLPYVYKNEGVGYETYPATDQPTNTGIIAADVAKYRGVKLSRIAPQDVKDLTPEEIEAIYLQQYWNPLRLSEVNDQGIATCVFDSGVVRGIGIGAKYAQRTCNSLGSSLVIDGQIGLHTLAALNIQSRPQFIRQYVALMEAGYDAIIESHPGDARYKKGWYSRASRLLTLI